MSKEQRQSLKLLKLGSFDVYKNTIVPIIAMLDHLELDIEVLDIGMKTTESDDCRGMLRNNRDANDVLTMT